MCLVALEAASSRRFVTIGNATTDELICDSEQAACSLVPLCFAALEGSDVHDMLELARFCGLSRITVMTVQCAEGLKHSQTVNRFGPLD